VSPSLLRRALAFAGLAPVFAGCNRVPPSAQDPQSAADAFFAEVEHGDPHTAYESAAFGFQAAQTFDAFLSNARGLGLIGAQPPTWTGKEAHSGETDLSGTFANSSGQPVTVSVTMTPDGKAWKLFSLQTAIGSQDTENRFTLVGKGTGFNDVYHQPMPAPRQLDGLVHKTMADFNAALQQGDFHSFYATLSQQWKDGQRLTGDDASQVTPGMLKNHFQPFIDKKVDLSMVANLKPVYTQTPRIDQDGLLELIGYFDTPNYRVNFSFDYAYELPWWKLFGINVNLTK
jgi:hypothetical protein